MLKNTGFIPVREIEYFDSSCVYIPERELKDYNLRVVRSGDVLEVYKFKEKVYYDYEQFERDPYEKGKPEEWNGKDENSLRRARREIRRVIWCNWNKYSKFLTLTYAENMQDLQQFYHDWKMFVQSLSRFGFKLRYLYVLEYQERGAIHAHVVIFNSEYIPLRTIERCWNRGFVKINAIQSVHNLGAYVCKYLTKDTLAEYNSKSYHCSKGLNRPVERKITLQEGADLIKELSSMGEVVFTSKYDVTINDIVTNQVEYSQVKLNTSELL